MSKLHEILAVESDLQNTAFKIMDEAKKTFSGRPAHFFGYHKKLDNYDESAPETPEEHQAMVTTVQDKLDYMKEHVTRYFDVVAQKDVTNQKACADVIVDGDTLLEKVPATFLLGMETKLKKLRDVYDAIPTLPPGVIWEADISQGPNIFRTKYPEKKFKTAKTFQHKVLYDATDKHPAQIERWEEDVPVGMYITERWSGMISPAQKSVLLGRIDKLLRAVKKARMRANTEEVEDLNVGDKIFGYIHTN